MGKSLSFDGILAALAVLSTGVTSVGCSKSESARLVEETRATPAATATSSTDLAAPMAAATAGEPARTSVDAGVEHRIAPGAASARKNDAPAACGAQGCSPDMKKGK